MRTAKADCKLSASHSNLSLAIEICRLRHGAILIKVRDTHERVSPELVNILDQLAHLLEVLGSLLDQSAGEDELALGIDCSSVFGRTEVPDAARRLGYGACGSDKRAMSSCMRSG